MTDPVMKNGSSPDGDTSSFVPRAAEQHHSGETKGSLFLYIAIAIGLAVFVRFFIATPFIVRGDSMLPTFDDYHYLIIDRLTYKLEDPKRGDIVVFDLPQNQHKDLIKRVIGLPGEVVQIEGNAVRIENNEHPEGFVLSEPYLSPQNLGGPTGMRVTLADDEFFVLGDNRRVSSDSRTWGILPKDDIVGRVFLRLFPLSRIGAFPGKSSYQE